MGTPDFAVPVLKAAADTGAEIVGVYTQPDKPVGRKQVLTPPPVKAFALEQGFPVFQPRRVKNSKAVAALRELQPDLILVAAYGQLLSQEILDMPKYGCINMHASLLPKYRGAAPIQRCIVNGDTVSGITAMQMNIGMDTGDMIMKSEVAITDTDTAETLHDKLAEAAGALTTTVLERLAAGTLPAAVPQQDEEATMAPMLSKEDGKIDWARSAKEIYDQIRGLYPWPGTYTFWQDKKLAVWEAVIADQTTEKAPGTVMVDRKRMLVACGSGVLEIRSLQLQGKKRMAADAFLLGNHPDGEVLQ